MTARSGSILRRLAAITAVVVAGTARAFDVNPSDSLTVGPHKYSANTLDLELAPSEVFSADLNVGNTKTSTPTVDTTKQIGGNLWWKPDPAVSLSLNVSAFTGQKAPILDPLSGDVVGDSDKRIANLVWGPTLGLYLVKSEPEAEVRRSVRMDLGVNLGRQTVPLFIGRSTTSVTELNASYVTKVVEPTIGIAARRGPSTLTATYGRHHYTDNLATLETAGRRLGTSPLRRFVLGNILYGLQNKIASAVQGQPKVDSTVGLTRRFLDDFALTGNYEYEEMEADGQIARTATVTLAWDAAKWSTVKLGTYWLNQFHATTEYETVGVSFFF